MTVKELRELLYSCDDNAPVKIRFDLGAEEHDETDIAYMSEETIIVPAGEKPEAGEMTVAKKSTTVFICT